MLQLDSLGDFEWRRLIERLDKGVAGAARAYLRSLHTRRIPIRSRSWDEELDELRLAREPDYGKPGLPLVYALKYMPRRAISILGALATVSRNRYPTTTLDIGSGTGATALALDLMNAPRHINLLGIEPSREMIRFADSSRFWGRVTARYEEGSVGDDTLVRLPVGSFDLVTFSASFPYQFNDWVSLLETIGSYEDNPGTMILAVEPKAKADILDSFARRLRARGWPTEWFCCHDLPEFIRRDDIPLKDTQEVWKQIGSPGSTPPRTWWSPPDDKFLIANPHASWPLIGENRLRQVRVSADREESRIASPVLGL